MVHLLISLLVLFCLATPTQTIRHLDPAGTPLMATNEAGAVVWKETYLPFGEKHQPSVAATNNTIGYTGKPYDNATGLSYMGARYYNPTLGRFTGIDPVGFNPDNLHSHNRYAYANNNPYKYVDPDGRIAFLAAVPPAIAYLTPIAYSIAARFAASSVYRFGMSVAIGETGFVAPASLAIGAGKVASVVAKEAGVLVTAPEVRAAGRSVFEANRATKILENGGKCVYCDGSKTTTGDHIKSVKAFANDVNAGKISLQDAVKNSSAIENIAEVCKSCNSSKGAKELSDSPGPGMWVPPNRMEGN